MISFYSGTPGSGKSLHLARDIRDILRNGRNVICNFPVTLPDKFFMRKKVGQLIYWDNAQITPQALTLFAQQHHVAMRENQTTVIIDEAGIIFNPRNWNARNRMSWCTFFSQHRKFGYNFILVSQFDRQIDRQIRSCFEYEVKHRKANNFGVIGGILTLLHVPVFFAITYWYGVNERCGISPFLYRKKFGRMYNTFATFTAGAAGH